MIQFNIKTILDSRVTNVCLINIKEILEEVAELEAQKELLKNKIRKYEGCDPEVLDKFNNDAESAKEAINRWTDNIFAVQSWIGKKFPGVNPQDMSKQFEIPEDLDYYE